MIYIGLGVLLLMGFGAVAVSQSGASTMKNWTRWDDLFKKYGSLYNVDWQWLKAIALNESSLGNASSVAYGMEHPTDIYKSQSSDGKSWGLMQITMPTALGLDSEATYEKLNNPEYSIKLAAKLVAELKRSFSTSEPRYFEYVIKSYNQGPGNTKKYDMKNMSGPWSDHVQEYWERFQRNLNKVKAG